VVILDLSDADPAGYYTLGQAYACGSELLLLARSGTVLPFDVAQAVLSYDNAHDLAEQLPAALNATLYGVQTLGLSALMHTSLQHCQRLASQAVGQQHADLLLQQLRDAALAPLAFEAALKQFLVQLGNSRLQLLYPRWPAAYPGEQRRCFVVMPFSEQLVSTQKLYQDLTSQLSSQGVAVVRGDQALGQDIVASIWEETAKASHVLVDLTGYNLNVCLELGMADAMGRDTFLMGGPSTAQARFAAIDKRRIHGYGEDVASQSALSQQVLAFVQRAGVAGCG
jgi:hypothetical protein